MATQPRSDRDFAHLTHIIAEARASKPAERVILQESLSDRLDSLIASERKSGILYSEGLREFKKKFILHVLAMNGWNQCRAAIELGMHRNTLSRTCAELKIDVRHEYLKLNASRKRAKRVEKSEARRTYGA